MTQHSRSFGHSLFGFLENRVGVLVVDDNDVVCNAIGGILRELFLFRVDTARSSAEAERIIKDRGCHICFLDLGLDDRGRDELYLLKKYAHDISFIIISGRGSMEAAQRCMNYGATACVDKPIIPQSDNFYDSIRQSLFFNILRARNADYPTEYLTMLELLIKNRPQSVSEWARLAPGDAIEERRLRRCCSAAGHKARSVLKLFHIIDRPFSCLIQDDGGCICNRTSCPDSSVCEKLSEYYYTHKSFLDNLLEMQPILRSVAA